MLAGLLSLPLCCLLQPLSVLAMVSPPGLTLEPEGHRPSLDNAEELKRTQEELYNHVVHLHTRRIEDDHNFGADIPHIWEVLDSALSSQRTKRLQFAEVVEGVEIKLKVAGLRPISSIVEVLQPPLEVLDQRTSFTFNRFRRDATYLNVYLIQVLKYFAALSEACDMGRCAFALEMSRDMSIDASGPRATLPPSVVLAESFLSLRATELKSLRHLHFSMRKLVAPRGGGAQYHFIPAEMAAMGVSPVQVFNILRFLLKVGEEVSPGLALLKAAADFKALGRALYHRPMGSLPSVSGCSSDAEGRDSSAASEKTDSQRRSLLRLLVPVVALSQGVSQEVVRSKEVEGALNRFPMRLPLYLCLFLPSFQTSPRTEAAFSALSSLYISDFLIEKNWAEPFDWEFVGVPFPGLRGILEDFLSLGPRASSRRRGREEVEMELEPEGWMEILSFFDHRFSLFRSQLNEDDYASFCCFAWSFRRTSRWRMETKKNEPAVKAARTNVEKAQEGFVDFVLSLGLGLSPYEASLLSYTVSLASFSDLHRSKDIFLSSFLNHHYSKPANAVQEVESLISLLSVSSNQEEGWKIRGKKPKDSLLKDLHSALLKLGFFENVTKLGHRKTGQRVGRWRFYIESLPLINSLWGLQLFRSLGLLGKRRKEGGQGGVIEMLNGFLERSSVRNVEIAAKSGCCKEGKSGGAEEQAKSRRKRRSWRPINLQSFIVDVHNANASPPLKRKVSSFHVSSLELLTAGTPTQSCLSRSQRISSSLLRVSSLLSPYLSGCEGREEGERLGGEMKRREVERREVKPEWTPSDVNTILTQLSLGDFPLFSRLWFRCEVGKM